jgi:segregation and condensation protein B
MEDEPAVQQSVDEQVGWDEVAAVAGERPDAGEPSAGDRPGIDDTTDDTTLGAPTLSAALEALLLVADVALDVLTLASLTRRPGEQVSAALAELADDYTSQGRGFELREVADGWRLYTREDCAEVVERFVRDGQQTRLTQAALETLAVVAYRQPVTRARISAVRGVNVDGVVRTLVNRGLVEEAGTDEGSGAVLYRTSSFFLERLGLMSLDELPPLADYLPDLDALDELLDDAGRD